jgi:hypothetical protein
MKAPVLTPTVQAEGGATNVFERSCQLRREIACIRMRSEAPPGPSEQLAMQLRLKQAQLLADGAFRYVKLLGRRANRPLPHNGLKRA